MDRAGGGFPLVGVLNRVQVCEGISSRKSTCETGPTDCSFVGEMVEDVAGLGGSVASLAEAEDEVDPLAEVQADVFRLECLGGGRSA